VREIPLNEVVFGRVLQSDGLKVRNAALVEIDVLRADGVGGNDGRGDLVREIELDSAVGVVLAAAEGGDEDLGGVSGVLEVTWGRTHGLAACGDDLFAKVLEVGGELGDGDAGCFLLVIVTELYSVSCVKKGRRVCTCSKGGKGIPGSSRRACTWTPWTSRRR
jgi:hypothetical protein